MRAGNGIAGIKKLAKSLKAGWNLKGVRFLLETALHIYRVPLKVVYFLGVSAVLSNLHLHEKSDIMIVPAEL